MYSLQFFGQMLTGQRMDAYVAALRETVKPDSVVMDLGCGPGVFALLACQLGARRVYAVEPNNVIGLARELAAANGFADRIEFFENFSTAITLEEPASIIVSDLRGVLPWFQHHIPSIIDARQRLLAPGGTLIPHRDVLWAAVVETPDRYEELVGPWNRFSLDLSAATRLITNNWRRARIRPEQLLTEPACWTTIDYYEVNNLHIVAEISCRAVRNGTAHGIALWFDSDLVDGIGFSNHPAEPETIYGNGLLPFSEPVDVLEGERITVQLAANMVVNDYVWRWDTEFAKKSFKQSTFYGVPLSPALLQKARIESA